MPSPARIETLVPGSRLAPDAAAAVRANVARLASPLRMNDGHINRDPKEYAMVGLLAVRRDVLLCVLGADEDLS